jgi:hypothetical protein
VNVRHDLVAAQIRTYAMKAACVVIREPQAWASQHRGDLEIITPNGDRIWIDTTVVQPTAPTYVKRGTGTATNALTAAQLAAREKHNAYDDICKQQDTEFYAASVEAFGGMTQETIALCKRIANFANRDDCPHTRYEIYRGLTSSISVAIQVGNARIAKRIRVLNSQAGLFISPPARAQPAEQPSIRLVFAASVRNADIDAADPPHVHAPEQPPAANEPAEDDIISISSTESESADTELLDSESLDFGAVDFGPPDLGAQAAELDSSTATDDDNPVLPDEAEAIASQSRQVRFVDAA